MRSRVHRPGPVRPQRVSSLSLYSFAASGLERLLALLFTALVAAMYGVSAGTDTYFVAQIFPLTIGSILLEATYATTLRRLMVGDGPDEQVSEIPARAISVVVSTAALLYAGLVLIFRPAHLEVWLTLAPLTIILGATGVYAAILVHQRRYALATMRAPLAAGFAVVLLAAATRFSDSIAILGASFTAAYAFVLCLLAYYSRGLSNAPPGRAMRAPDVLQQLGAAATAAAAAGPLIPLLERAAAKMLRDGSITLLVYARGLALLPLLATTAIANGLFPTLLQKAGRDPRRRETALVVAGVRIGIGVALVTSVLIIVRRRELVRLTLARGEFTPSDAAKTAELVALLGLSVVGLAAIAIATRVLFAFGRNRTVFAIGGGTLVVYAAAAPVLALASGTTGLAAGYTVLAVLAGVVALHRVMTILAVRPGQAVREWLAAPFLLALPFYLGVWLAQVLVPTSAHVGRAASGMLLSLSLGLTFLGVTILAVRPSEYVLLRRVLRQGTRGA